MLQAFYFLQLFLFSENKKGAEPARKSRQPCAFCFDCKLLKNAYFAILTNSLQINVIIYRLFNILLHLDCINGRAVNARVAVCAGIVLASKAHPTKPTAALDMYAAVYKADGRAYLYAVDLLAVNARVAVCTRAAVFDLREPTAALEMNAIINIAVFGIDFKSFHRLSKVARVVLAVFYLREPMAPRVCGIRQIARAGGLWLTRLGCRL